MDWSQLSNWVCIPSLILTLPSRQQSRLSTITAAATSFRSAYLTRALHHVCPLAMPIDPYGPISLTSRRAELGRAAQVAVRSTTTSLLRTAPIRSRPCRTLALARAMSTTSSLRSFNELTRPKRIAAAPLSGTQQQSYYWTDPSRVLRKDLDNIADIDIRKPKSPLSNDDGGKADQELVDFASDLEFADVQSNRYPKAAPPTAPRAHLRLVPRLGRTVHVGANVDVARSFKLLAVQVGQNKLRREFQLQRFHERPGTKRKRLRGERWQTRFKKGFKATISRVRELTAQGW